MKELRKYSPWSPRLAIMPILFGWLMLAFDLGCTAPLIDSVQSQPKPTEPPISTSKSQSARHVDHENFDSVNFPVTIPKPEDPSMRLPDEAMNFQLHRPKVILSQGHANTCLRKVGDSLSDLTFNDEQDNSVILRQKLGKRLTVVVFWELSQAMSREQISRLSSELVHPYSGTGVRIIAVNVGNSEPEAAPFLTDQQITCTWLHDEERKSFAKIALGLLPRTYVLDANGTIIWFDIEYSRGMRLELQDALLFYLRQYSYEARSVAGMGL